MEKMPPNARPKILALPHPQQANWILLLIPQEARVWQEVLCHHTAALYLGGTRWLLDGQPPTIAMLRQLFGRDFCLAQAMDAPDAQGYHLSDAELRHC